MRTRHILTALALPALFAACTADEFEGANSNGLQERAKLSKDFTLVTDGSASTRYSVEGDAGIKFVYDEMDKIGAAIIDQYDPSYPDQPEKWEVIYSLAGNYPFKYVNENEWKADTELGVGHYLFVYPYNAKDNNRAAVSYELPVIQKMYETENGPQVLNAAITAGNKAVAATILHEGETLANVNMKNLFTYPKVTINFDNGQKVTTVSQVVLKRTTANGGFLVKGGYDHKNVSAMFANDASLSSEDYWDGEKQAVDWDKVQTEDFLIASSNDEAKPYGAPETAEYLIVKFPANTKVKLDNEQNKYVEARFMMPSMDNFTTTNIEMYVYTDNGVYVVDFNAGACSFKSTTSADAKKGVLNRSRSNSVTLKALNSSNIEPKEVENIVTTVADWNNLVATYGATAVDQKIAIVGNDFAFDATAKMPSKAVFEVSTPVSVKGNVTLSNVTVTNDVTVEKGATLTTSATFTATNIVNKGTVIVAVVKDKEGDVEEYTGVSAITNEGTLNIPATSVAAFELTNEKTGVVENKGTMNISGTNEGTINNNGTMNTTADFTNDAREYKNEELINDPTINNAEDAKILAKSGKLTNKATIVNAGTLTCKNQSGRIINGATSNRNTAEQLPAILDSKADAISYITNNANGKVIVYSANTEFLTIAENKGIVEYTTAAAAESFKNSLVNTVIASKSYEVKDGSLTSLTLNGTAALKMGKDATLSALTVNKGTTTLGTDVSIIGLTIAKGAKVTVPAGMTLAIEGSSMENKGTILVGGKFIANQIESAKGGLVEDNGNGEITWKQTSADTAEADYNKAVKRMVEAYILKSDSWSAVDAIKAADFTSGDSGLTGSTAYADLLTAAFTAYNAWMDAQGKEKVSEDGFKSLVMNSGKFKAAIDAYKTLGNNYRAAAIKASIKDNSWVTTEVYVKAATDTKLIDIKTSVDATMVSAFAAKVKAITGVKVVTAPANASTEDKDAALTTNKATELSLKAVQGTDATITATFVQASWIPAYSYIETYATSDLYKVMNVLVNNDFDVAWYKDTTLDTAVGVREAVALIYDKYHGVPALGILEKTKIEESGILDYVDTVLKNWKYTDEQIAAMETEVTT